jgi:hypothetical protein
MKRFLLALVVALAVVGSLVWWRGHQKAARDAAKDAQKTARMYGTPLYVWENGKVVAKKP